MSYKNTEVQPELFTLNDKKRRKKTLRKRLFSINYKSALTISVDTIVVLVISLLMVNLLSFAIGIERGKKIAFLPGKKVIKKATKRVMTLEQVKHVKAETTKQSETCVKKQPKKKVVPVENKGFTIQLVTYSNDGIAKKEVARLKADGVNGFCLKKGNLGLYYPERSV